MKTSPQEQATTESAAVLDESKQQTTGAGGNFYRTRPLAPTFTDEQIRNVPPPVATAGLAGAHVMSRTDIAAPRAPLVSD